LRSNVFGDLGDGLLAGFKAVLMDECGFQGTPEALDGGVVVTIAAPGHGELEAVLVQAPLVVPSTILAASIRVTDQSRPRAAGLQRLCERLAHQALAQVIGHRVADDPATVEVFDPGQIQPAFVRGHAGDVAGPCPVGPLDLKTALVAAVAKQFTTGGKPRLGPISKRGKRPLRALLIQGIRALSIYMKRDHSALGDWLQSLEARRYPLDGLLQ